jgi:L-histidine Nalpha-methyltransferase
MSELLAQSTFLKELKNGLQAKPKRISSKYFYDQKGSEIFQQIMEMDEYYLPACEKSILQNESENIAAAIRSDSIQVLELGAGDGTKTSILLQKLMQSGKNIHYYPMDISADILEFNRKNLAKKLPDLKVSPIAGDYHRTMRDFRLNEGTRLILFLGSNIGNFKPEDALDFLAFVKDCMDIGDHFLLAADLKKNPSQVLKAYSDPGGLTKQFNMNLLERINRELNGNFDLKAFDHYATYNPLDGLALSFLVSLKKQEVTIDGYSFLFEKYESVHTEISKKYDSEELKQLMENAGFKSTTLFYDSNNWYTLALGKVG